MASAAERMRRELSRVAQDLRDVESAAGEGVEDLVNYKRKVITGMDRAKRSLDYARAAETDCPRCGHKGAGDCPCP